MNITQNRFVAATSVLAGAILTAVLLFTAVPRLHAQDVDRRQPSRSRGTWTPQGNWENVWTTWPLVETLVCMV